MGETMEKEKSIWRRISEAIDRSRILFILKMLVFFTLIYTAMALYTVHNIYLANDVIMMAAIFIILNKLDKV